MTAVETEGPEMKPRTLEPTQHTAAKVVGFLYLFTMASAIFGELFVRGRLMVRGDAVQTATNIAKSERLFRLGIVSDTAAWCTAHDLA